MAIEWSSESFKAKEESKWNRKKRDGGMNADSFEMFPLMLYKARIQPISGKYEVAMARDVISADKTVVLLDAEQFNSSCQMTVRDEAERERAIADGWRESQAEAMVYAEGTLDRLAQEAAHRAHDDRNRSERAKAEVEAFESRTHEHVAEIPEKPRVKRAYVRRANRKKKEAGIAEPV